MATAIAGVGKSARMAKVKVTKIAKRTLGPTRRQERAARKKKRLDAKKAERKPHPETLRRRRRKAKQAKLNELPTCPIGRDEIKPTDRIFLGQSHLVPGNPHRATLWRWAKYGVQLVSGATVRFKLPTFRAGSRRWTSLRHFAWWQEQLDKAG